MGDQDSVGYYNDNALSFYESTANVDMKPLYDHFLPLIPKGGSILDAGCGSGRDTKNFRKMGYETTAFDASKELAELAERNLGIKVEVMTFNDIQWKERFDGIWACASLLHVPKSELPGIFKKLAEALKTGGVIYCSFKYGDSESERDERKFTNLNEASLKSALNTTNLSEKLTWLTEDLRPGRGDERWINAILLRNC